LTEQYYITCFYFGLFFGHTTQALDIHCTIDFFEFIKNIVISLDIDWVLRKKQGLKKKVVALYKLSFG